TNDCSRNVYIKKNGFTLHRNPIAQSTDGARTKIGFSEGRHAWEVWWEGPLGTVAVIGIATKRAAMQCQGYVALLGSDDQSWGWNLVDNNLLHNGEVNGSFPQCNNAPKYQIGERIRVILDMEDKTLAFERGYEFLGVAFRGLPKVCLYPAVSAVYENVSFLVPDTGNSLSMEERGIPLRLLLIPLPVLQGASSASCCTLCSGDQVIQMLSWEKVHLGLVEVDPKEPSNPSLGMAVSSAGAHRVGAGGK
ncbi:F-box/SPRY domain-containing protein 1, partial [Lamprotornis superbus]